MTDLRSRDDAIGHDADAADDAGAPAPGTGPESAGLDRVARFRRLVAGARPSAITRGDPILPLVVLFAIALIDEMDKSALGVLTPEIRDYFGLDLTAVTILLSLTGVLTLALAVPTGFLSDRVSRTKLTAIGAALLGLFGIATGIVPTLTLFAITRAGAGLGRTLDPTHASLLADYYPQETRAGVYGYRQIGVELGRFIGPIVAGLVATLIIWQASFIVLGLPALVFAVLAWRLREPVRGEQERRAMGADEETALTAETPPSFAEAVRIAWNVRTLRRILYSLPFLVGSVLSLQSLISLYYEDLFHVGTGTRGVLIAMSQPFAIAGLLIGSSLSNRFLAERPGRVITYAGLMGVGGAVCIAGIAVSPFLALSVALSWTMTFAMAIILPASSALLSLVVPARARGLALSLGAIAIVPGYLMFTLAGALGDHYGLRGAFLIFVPILAVGAGIIASSGATIEPDIRAATAAAMAAQIARDAKERGEAKLLVVNDLDVSYGQVQVLFNVDFEVEEGEIIALLGTNGAGKSTLLRAIGGITPPGNGAIFYDGEDITHLPPFEHAGRGIVTVPGGKGTFPSLSVAENLRMAAWTFRSDDAYIAEATEQVFAYFPVLRERLGEAAGNLSGGQQQMLVLGQAFLARPRLLMIDELSLGLAPAVVESLLGIVRAIHERGTTIILVEQSVNVALTVAKRAVFMEKGEVRFSGSTADLLSRPDILRSVYLKGSAALGGTVTVGQSGFDTGVVATEVALEVSGVTKRFGGVGAVNGVSFTLNEGHILGLIGPNGAGKTTLFDIVSGFVRPDEGQILLHGEDVTDLGPDRRAMLGLLRSFQDARLFPALTVAENLAVSFERHIGVRSSAMAALHLPNVRASEAKIRKRVERLIELFALGSTRDKFVRELSTGQRRIVDMACVLAAEPKVLLLDEPSSGIAQREAEELGPLLLRIQRETGCTMLLIEHDMPLIMAVAEELIALELGAVVTRGTPREVVEHPQVIASYLGTTDEVINRSGTT